MGGDGFPLAEGNHIKIIAKARVTVQRIRPPLTRNAIVGGTSSGRAGRIPKAAGGTPAPLFCVSRFPMAGFARSSRPFRTSRPPLPLDAPRNHRYPIGTQSSGPHVGMFAWFRPVRHLSR